MAANLHEKAMQERREIGLELISEMISPGQADAIRDRIAADHFGSELLRMTMDQCYSDVWSREGLSRKERSLVTLGALIALKAAPEMVYQYKIALKNGLTPRQLEEVILQALTYVGIPAANLANAVAIETLQELGIETENRTE